MHSNQNKDQTISTLTGFILGSLSVLWPWQNEIYLVDTAGEYILKNGDKISQGSNYIPETFNTEVIIAILLMIFGFITISLIEKIASKEN